jgi:hypothetical protein
MARYRLFFVAALAPLLAAMPAAAQQDDRPIAVAPSVCDAIAHVNDAAGVAYAPGVDVDGSAVAPADLPGGDAALGQALASAPIGIAVDLRRHFGIPAGAKLFHGEAQIGYVAIRGGQAYLDGQGLNTAEEGLLEAACREGKR